MASADATEPGMELNLLPPPAPIPLQALSWSPETPLLSLFPFADDGFGFLPLFFFTFDAAHAASCNGGNANLAVIPGISITMTIVPCDTVQGVPSTQP